MQWNVYRANIRAAAAERRCIAQVLVIPHVLEIRRDDRANRTGIHCPIGVTPDILVDRAGIQAGAATDARQGPARPFLLQHFCPAVVEQDHVHFFRPVGFSFFPSARK